MGDPEPTVTALSTPQSSDGHQSVDPDRQVTSESGAEAGNCNPRPRKYQCEKAKRERLIPLPIFPF
jgi:hypothetical protein